MMTQGPPKGASLGCGVQAISVNASATELLVGSGDGELMILDLTVPSLQPKCVQKVLGAVSSIAMDSAGEFFFAGTEKSNMYLVQYDGLVAEHKGPVYAISIKADDSECVSASADGSCITWSLSGLQSFTRINALFAANFFKSVLYHPDESQLLTCGTDRKLTYWDVADMNAIRIVDGSQSAEINTLDIS